MLQNFAEQLHISINLIAENDLSCESKELHRTRDENYFGQMLKNDTNVAS